jgi:hypothetical protein
MKMRIRRSWYANYVKPWEDRVAGVDESFDGVEVDVDRIVEDALAAARTAVECAVTPLAEVLAGLPRAIDIEWIRESRHARRRRHRRASASERGSASERAAAWDW